MSIDDDEIAERIAKQIRGRVGDFATVTYVANFRDDALACRLAHYDDVRERAAIRRQDKRVWPKVFRLLGLADRNEK